MQIKKKNVNKTLIFFLFAHLIVWTLVPSVSNTNLPLDTIEALAWGNELQFGYHKHPPLSAWFPEFFYQIFGSQDWAYYFLSQIFVIMSFIIIFKFSENFFQNKIYSLLSILLLEGIYFYNFTTPEFNVYVCQLPFWAATVYYCWRGIKQNDNISWVLLGVFAGLGMLSFYLTFYLLLSLVLFFIYIIVKEKRFNYKYLISLFSFFIILLPHLIWLVDNDYITINNAIFRSVNDPLSGFEGSKFLDHLFYPFLFLLKQISLIIPFVFMLLIIVTKFKTKINYRDKKFLFLISITILPLVFMFFTSLITGARIRTMWMTSFYLYTGVLFMYIYQTSINLKKLKSFFLVFLFLFIFSPMAYYVVSYNQTNQRTDYPGKEISERVQNKWESNFSNKIEIVVGYGWINGGWFAGNLSYHLESRPKWKTELKDEINVGTIWIQGFNKIDNCKGVLYQIKPLNDICMFGKK